MKTRTKSIIIALGLALCITASLTIAGAFQARQVAEASAVDGHALYTWTNNGIIATTNGTGRVTGDYGVFECYAIVDVTLPETVTITFQSSPDNTNFAAEPVWQFSSNVLAATAGMTAISADGTSFATVPIYGLYTRPVFTLSTTNPITVTLRCVGKDRPGYDINQDAGAQEMTD
jgi:hypothetical protein